MRPLRRRRWRRSDSDALRRLKALHERGFISGDRQHDGGGPHRLRRARRLGFDTHLLVHELPRIIREKDLAAGATAGLAAATTRGLPGSLRPRQGDRGAGPRGR